MYLAILGNQLLSSNFADYISILSKIDKEYRYSMIDDYQNKAVA